MFKSTKLKDLRSRDIEGCCNSGKDSKRFMRVINAIEKVSVIIMNKRNSFYQSICTIYLFFYENKESIEIEKRKSK